MPYVFAERRCNADQQNKLFVMKHVKYMFNKSDKVKRALFWISIGEEESYSGQKW
jgi:hypothetical protein